MTTDAAPALLVGAVLGDSDRENMAWSRAIGALSREAEVLSSGVETPLRVNVVYHVAGQIAPNEFEGVRTGRFNRGKGLLEVQAAVTSRSSAESRELLLQLIEDAITAAEAFAKRRAIAESLPALRRLVSELSR